MMKKNEKDMQERIPSAEEVSRELGKATSINDFLWKRSHLCEVNLQDNRRNARSGIDIPIRL